LSEIRSSAASGFDKLSRARNRHYGEGQAATPGGFNQWSRIAKAPYQPAGRIFDVTRYESAHVFANIHGRGRRVLGHRRIERRREQIAE
jgi:hypothetical protein